MKHGIFHAHKGDPLHHSNRVCTAQILLLIHHLIECMICHKVLGVKSSLLFALTCESRRTDTNITWGFRVAEWRRQLSKASMLFLWGQLYTCPTRPARVPVAFVDMGLTLGTRVSCRIKVQRSSWVETPPSEFMPERSLTTVLVPLTRPRVALKELTRRIW